MQLKVQKIGDDYGVLFPRQVFEDLSLAEGSLVDLDSRDGKAHLAPMADEARLKVEIFLRTEPAHADTYRELAK